MLNWSYRQPNTPFTDWVIRQLDIQPYQHLLEIGCGTGRLLSAVTARLHNNFLAATEPSMTNYRRALRRNKSSIKSDCLQLHLGKLYDLSYPASYFHTIYGSGSYYSWKNSLKECLRLGMLLRDGGRLILISEPGHYRTENDLRTEAARLQAAYINAGLTEIHTEFRTFRSGECLTITGSKPIQAPDPSQRLDCQSSVTINNRLLNPEAYFISNSARMQI